MAKMKGIKVMTTRFEIKTSDDLEVMYHALLKALLTGPLGVIVGPNDFIKRIHDNYPDCNGTGKKAEK